MDLAEILSEKKIRRAELLKEIDKEMEKLSDNQLNLLMAFMMGVQVGQKQMKIQQNN